jgi:hypothetical protein
MTETTIPTTTFRQHSGTRVAALSLAFGAALGVAGTVLATGGDDVPARPAVVEPMDLDQPASSRDASESSCRLFSADAAERCVAARAETSCHLISADAAERCVAARAEST